MEGQERRLAAIGPCRVLAVSLLCRAFQKLMRRGLILNFTLLGHPV